MKVIHIIENWASGDNQVLEVIAKNAKTALAAYLRYSLYDNVHEAVEFEKLSENIFVTTWNREWGF